MKILFLGAPGSGKSTQGRLLAEGLGFDWVSSGQLFREDGDPKILKIVESGQLVPDEIVEEMMAEAIFVKEKVILDGFPRNLEQCRFLVENNIDLDLIVEIVVPKEELLKRMLLRGRKDDNEKTILERIDFYNHNRDLIVDFFEKEGVKIVRIDGTGEVGEIQERIREEIL